MAYRIMKLIIAEQGNNSWLAHGTPHLNVRTDYVDTATGINGYPGRYYAVLRNTAVIPAIFGRIFEGVACRMASK